MKRTDAAHRRAVDTDAAHRRAVDTDAAASAPSPAARPGRPPRGLTALACAVAAVACLGLSACTADGDASARSARGAGGDAFAPGPDLTWADDLRISDAEQHLITQCMRAHGFHFWDERRPSLAESRPLGYVQDDVRWARAHGYGSRIAAEEDRARLANPNIAYRKALAPARQAAYDTAMDGGHDAALLRTKAPVGGTVTKQSGGCTGRAEKTLYGDPAKWFEADTTVSNLRPLYVNKLLHDPQFTTAVRAWSRCMGDAGLPYPDPGAARRATREHGARQSPAEEAKTFAREIRVAVADATCARTVSLRSIGERREAHYVGRLTDEYGDALDTYRRIRRLALARAERIVPARA